MDFREDGADDLQRLPGLFRRWELPLLLQVGTDYRIEDAGETGDGTPLVAVYRAGTETGGVRS